MVKVMGIVNVTPDSFSDGGLYLAAEHAIAHALALVREGADIVDIGGESTRPGAQPVTAEEEIARVVPVVAALADRADVTISVDTSKPQVMRATVAAGATFINDVRALRGPGALEAAAELGVTVALMHMQGEPRTMQDAPSYRDVVAEVLAFLTDRVQECTAAGIAWERIVIDPGFGFGKTIEHNMTLLANLHRFTELGVPVMVGLSRKSTIGKVTGRPLGGRLIGSVAAALLAAERGASIVRVHDVAATRDALAILAALPPPTP